MKTSTYGRDRSGVVLGNVYDKYASRNPAARFLLSNYLRSLRRFLDDIEIGNLLEVGCGEGRLARILQAWYPSAQIVGIDLSPSVFEMPVDAVRGPQFVAQSAYQLGFAGGSFDVVVGAEVLEHLEHPDRALGEMERVARRHLVLSVPREPIWRFLNVARLSYLSELGNTPGHVQHWSGRRFKEFVGRRLDIVASSSPLPWTMVLGRIRRDPRAAWK